MTAHGIFIMIHKKMVGDTTDSLSLHQTVSVEKHQFLLERLTHRPLCVLSRFHTRMKVMMKIMRVMMKIMRVTITTDEEDYPIFKSKRRGKSSLIIKIQLS